MLWGLSILSRKKKWKDSPPYLDRFLLMKQKVVKGPPETTPDSFVQSRIKKSNPLFKYAQWRILVERLQTSTIVLN